jgi:hypothetical protein
VGTSVGIEKSPENQMESATSPLGFMNLAPGTSVTVRDSFFSANCTTPESAIAPDYNLDQFIYGSPNSNEPPKKLSPISPWSPEGSWSPVSESWTVTESLMMSSCLEQSAGEKKPATTIDPWTASPLTVSPAIQDKKSVDIFVPGECPSPFIGRERNPYEVKPRRSGIDPVIARHSVSELERPDIENLFADLSLNQTHSNHFQSLSPRSPPLGYGFSHEIPP